MYPRFCYEKNFPMKIRWTTVKILLKSKSNPNSVREKVGNRNHFNTRHSWWINNSHHPLASFFFFLFWCSTLVECDFNSCVSIKYATFVYIKTESKSWLTIQKFTKSRDTNHEDYKYDRTSFIGISPKELAIFASIDKTSSDVIRYYKIFYNLIKSTDHLYINIIKTQ